MTKADLVKINAGISKLVASGKGKVNCAKKQAEVLKGQLSLSLSSVVDNLKRNGVKVHFVEELS